jgi:hypothetical protein
LDKDKVKMITMPGWRQVVVQLSTNSWRHVHISAQSHFARP